MFRPKFPEKAQEMKNRVMEDSFFQYANLFKTIATRLKVAGVPQELMVTAVHPKLVQLEHQLGSLRTQTKLDVLTCISQLEQERTQLEQECKTKTLDRINHAIISNNNSETIDQSKLNQVDDVVRKAVDAMIKKQVDNNNNERAKLMKQRHDVLCRIMQDGETALRKLDVHLLEDMKSRCKTIMTQHKMIVRQYVFQFYAALEEINRVLVTTNAALQGLKFGNDVAAAAAAAAHPWWLLSPAAATGAHFQFNGGVGSLNF